MSNASPAMLRPGRTISGAAWAQGEASTGWPLLLCSSHAGDCVLKQRVCPAAAGHLRLRRPALAFLNLLGRRREAWMLRRLRLSLRA